MTTEEKFKAAVEVVNSIPYDGTFEPSEEIMLKFYAYEMQAKEGPCNHPKPYIWNAVARNKWFAWSELGDMSQEIAMENYIKELSKVIETMSYNEKIAKFISLMGSFYEVVCTEEIDSPEEQKNESEAWPEEMIPSTILENYQSPTISDVYHLSKKGEEDNWPIPSYEPNHIIESAKDDCSELASKVYPHISSSSSSASFSSEISNFDMLSDLSDNEFNPTTEMETLHLFRNNKICSRHHTLTRNNLFLLTFINLQSSMEEILEKLDNLRSLATIQERNPTVINNYSDWNLNLTGTAVALLWPIIVGVLLQ